MQKKNAKHAFNTNKAKNKKIAKKVNKAKNAQNFKVCKEGSETDINAKNAKK